LFPIFTDKRIPHVFCPPTQIVAQAVAPPHFPSFAEAGPCCFSNSCLCCYSFPPSHRPICSAVSFRLPRPTCWRRVSFYVNYYMMNSSPQDRRDSLPFLPLPSSECRTLRVPGVRFYTKQPLLVPSAESHPVLPDCELSFVQTRVRVLFFFYVGPCP